MNRKIYCLILIITIVGSLMVPAMATDLPLLNHQQQEKSYIQLGSQEAIIRGDQHILNVSPEKINSTTYIPLDLVAKMLEAKVEWLAESKKVIVSKDNKKIELMPGKQLANRDGHILIPLRMISDRFNLGLYYSETGVISLVPLIAPIAQFKFLAGPYIAGRNIEFINESYSPDEQAIKESHWEIRGNIKTIKTRDLKKALKSLQAGTYHVQLQVRDTRGAWSEPVEQSILIQPHPKPVITSFAAIKLDWDQGETLEFEYGVDKEDWVEITESRWTYHKKGQATKNIGPARALFEEGTYTIGLRVKDNFDTWSLVSNTEINISNHVKKTELAYKFGDIKAGEIVDNFDRYNFQNYQPVEDFTVQSKGPQLLFSNSPETVMEKGILYADKVLGDTRLLYHHRNGMRNKSDKIRLVIIVENGGNEPATITQTKKSHAGPSEDILHLGQIVTRRYFNSKLDNKISLQANEKKFLYDTGGMSWRDYESLSGMLEFHSDKLIRVTVAAVDEKFQLSQLGNLSPLARDGIHTRGTFKGANKYYNVLIPEDRPSKLLLGQSGDQMDSWIDGYDALTGAKEKNKGNYGLVYDLDLTSKEKTGILINPRGDSFKGAFRWENANVSLAPDQGVFVGSSQSSVVGELEPKSTRKLFYTLSNGSSGPVLFNFIPESFWEDYKIEGKYDN